MQGTCDGSGQCLDTDTCSDAKQAQIAECVADCSSCTAAVIDGMLGGCTVEGVTQAYGTTFCADADCVLAAAPTAADCTADCGTLTQEITTAAIGSGTCTQETYDCQPGDGSCECQDTATMSTACADDEDCNTALQALLGNAGTVADAEQADLQGTGW